MKWSQNEPKPGDMVRVKIGTIYHFGIFVSEDEIIQFGPPPSQRLTLPDSAIEVCVTDAAGFLLGGFIETAEPERKDGKKKDPKDIIEYARSKIGQRGYNILYNNCEHFAYECLFGVKKCTQADDVRELFRNMPILDVYTAKIPDSEDIDLDSISPKERRKEIASVKNPRVALEKYYVWKLLSYAITRTFGQKIQDISFRKEKSGRWTCSKCFFSLSHTEGAVAVAVSRGEVGIDIEAIKQMPERVGEKILTEKERAAFEELPVSDKNKYLIEKWTEKESIFKKNAKDSFSPGKTETTKATVLTKTISVMEREYVLSVASDSLSVIRYYENIEIH